MAATTLMPEPDLVDAGGARIAVVRCKDVVVPRADLADLPAALPGDARAVAFVRHKTDADKIAVMAAIGIPCVVGVAVTDAIKSVEGTVVTGTVDRSTLFTIELPIVVPVASVTAAASVTSGADTVHLGELCALAEAIAIVA